MKLTKKRAIERTIEHWGYLAETGKLKGDWDKLEEYGYALHNCFLCGYSHSANSLCRKCPYQKHFHYMPSYSCQAGESPYSAWLDARTKAGRKKYASLFLEQLRSL